VAGSLFASVATCLVSRPLSITHHQLSLSLSSPRAVTPCPLSLPRLPPIPTLPPFSTLLSKNTSVTLSKTSPTIPFFPGFNPVIPLKPSSPSFESKSSSSNQSQNSDDPLTKWVTPTVNVLYSFSATLGGVVGLVNITIFSYDIVQSNIYLQACHQQT
jgi:hypothetical protein